MNRSDHHLSPQNRYYLGELTAGEAATLYRAEAHAERIDTGYSGLNKVVVILGVLLFLPVALLAAVTGRR
jgi:hypothetical protein